MNNLQLSDNDILAMHTSLKLSMQGIEKHCDYNIFALDEETKNMYIDMAELRERIEMMFFPGLKE
ncbi:Uncharacterised protein [Niallia circulans]|jgi:hypothetical protein|uniref:hypothetical protein n=1 Tax=Niallia circulans TaxID=1397 RepID=UPI00077C7F2D|nr:hypothetical protein [Niallia circulans]MDR4315009.1 hypothetical protein [Niallia circulans]MED3839734.1 hypothetical protein [Niallia circulans]MED4241219.1 hypothetical protein [Niallia circulans]MED4247880.1 hypothetical protein [Niallia circulans]QKH61638.1 hypothetical protein FOC77_13760 [Niallia circulans]